jgi:hypothetical protein
MIRWMRAIIRDWVSRGLLDGRRDTEAHRVCAGLARRLEQCANAGQ